jgi:pectinesterase
VTLLPDLDGGEAVVPFWKPLGFAKQYLIVGAQCALSVDQYETGTVPGKDEPYKATYRLLDSQTSFRPRRTLQKPRWPQRPSARVPGDGVLSMLPTPVSSMLRWASTDSGPGPGRVGSQSLSPFPCLAPLPGHKGRSMRHSSLAFATTLGCLLTLGACGSTAPGPSGSGGNSAAGGATGSGGARPSGGVTGNGGSTAAGGATATGGTMATGGSARSGGTTGSSGGMSSGGADTGGSVATGGAQTGGTSGTGGAATGGTGNPGGTTGSGGASQPPVTCTPAHTGSDSRPQLTDAAAACYTIKNYLAQAGTIGSLVRDDWDPSATPWSTPASPTYTVAADGSGTHASVQAAINAALASGGTSRVYILVKPGTYRELVCVKPPSGAAAVPVTLYGADSDASKVTIVYNNGSGVTVTAENTNPCATKDAGTTHGTSDSTTFFVSTAKFEAANLTIANDFAEPADQSSVQAPALTVQADQVLFQNVRFLGNQDTLQVKSSSVTTVARSYFKGCYVEGDVDFIFGRGTAVFDGCTIKYLTSRKTGSTIFAPSTESSHAFGMLVVGSQIGSASGTNSTFLGRAWDDSSGTSPNGQIVIRESALDASIRTTAPWTTSTQGRAYSAASNRMYEYKNTGAGAAQ